LNWSRKTSNLVKKALYGEGTGDQPTVPQRSSETSILLLEKKYDPVLRPTKEKKKKQPPIGAYSSECIKQGNSTYRCRGIKR